MGDTVQTYRIIIEGEDHSIVFRNHYSKVASESCEWSHIEFPVKDAVTQLLGQLRKLLTSHYQVEA